MISPSGGARAAAASPSARAQRGVFKRGDDVDIVLVRMPTIGCSLRVACGLSAGPSDAYRRQRHYAHRQHFPSEASGAAPAGDFAVVTRTTICRLSESFSGLGFGVATDHIDWLAALIAASTCTLTDWSGTAGARAAATPHPLPEPDVRVPRRGDASAGNGQGKSTFIAQARLKTDDCTGLRSRSATAHRAGRCAPGREGRSARCAVALPAESTGSAAGWLAPAWPYRFVAAPAPGRAAVLVA